MESFGKLVERSHLTLVVLGAFLLLVAALADGSSVSNLTLVIEPAWRYVLATIGIISFGTGLYLMISRGDSERKESIKKTRAPSESNLKPPSPQHSHSADFKKFLDIGMEKIHDYLTDDNIRKRLATSQDIRVLKTWFPESDQIEAGLISAIKNGAKVRLLLCKPGSVILEQRSLGAGKHASTGSLRIYRAVERVYDLVTTIPRADVQIACYESWPGCPVIWCDNEILMGFYFRGAASPSWPWISVTKGSKLAKILDDQFEGLWNPPKTEKPDTRTEKLDTPEKMAKWLEDNKLWQEK